MSLNGLHTISLYNNANGTVLQFNKLKDSDGEIVIAQPFEDNKNPRGEVIHSGEDNTLEFMCYDDGLLAQLQTWQKAGTKIQAVGAGFDKNLQWYQDTPVRVLPRQSMKAGNLNARVVRMNIAGDNLPIYSNVNLLAYLGWADGNGNGIPDNYSTSGSSVSRTFTEFTYEVNAATAPNGLHSFLVFPISNIELTLSNNIVNSAAFALVRLDNRSFDSTSILIASKAVSGIGILDLKSKSPNSVFGLYIDFIRVNPLPPTPIYAIKFPALTTNGELTSADAFMNY